MENLGKTIYILVLAITKLMSGAFILMKLWGWFITPAFNTPTISIIESVGIILVLGTIFFKVPNQEEYDAMQKMTEINRRFRLFISGNLTILLLGWIFQSFI